MATPQPDRHKPGRYFRCAGDSCRRQMSPPVHVVTLPGGIKEKHEMCGYCHPNCGALCPWLHRRPLLPVIDGDSAARVPQHKFTFRYGIQEIP